jgi:hypothetical protein
MLKNKRRLIGNNKKCVKIAGETIVYLSLILIYESYYKMIDSEPS